MQHFWVLTYYRISALWMHFLFKDVPPKEDKARELDWFKSACVLHWKDATQVSGPALDKAQDVTLLCFGGLKPLQGRIKRMKTSADWINVVANPYILVNLFLESWYDHVDKTVWHANDRVSELEKASPFKS